MPPNGGFFFDVFNELNLIMYQLHVFPTSEDLYDVICGCESHYTHTFPDQATAELWFKEEYGDSGWCFLSESDLQQQRAEFMQSQTPTDC